MAPRRASGTIGVTPIRARARVSAKASHRRVIRASRTVHELSHSCLGGAARSSRAAPNRTAACSSRRISGAGGRYEPELTPTTRTALRPCAIDRATNIVAPAPDAASAKAPRGGAVARCAKSTVEFTLESPTRDVELGARVWLEASTAPAQRPRADAGWPGGRGRSNATSPPRAERPRVVDRRAARVRAPRRVGHIRRRLRPREPRLRRVPLHLLAEELPREGRRREAPPASATARRRGARSSASSTSSGRAGCSTNTCAPPRALA